MIPPGMIMAILKVFITMKMVKYMGILLCSTGMVNRSKTAVSMKSGESTAYYKYSYNKILISKKENGQAGYHASFW